MAGSGGKRPGAGRKPGARSVFSKELAREILVKARADLKLENLVNSKNEKIALMAIQFLADHVWGKPQQNIELSGSVNIAETLQLARNRLSEARKNG